METIQLVAPCHFGMEAVLKREIYDLGYDITKVEDGRVTFEGDLETICRSNIFLRTAERVMVQIGRFRATTFDELYENMKALPWEDWIPQDGKFWVKKASSVKSKLFSASDIQSSHGKAFMFSYNSSKVVARNLPICTMTRSAVRRSNGGTGYDRRSFAQEGLPDMDKQGTDL